MARILIPRSEAEVAVPATGGWPRIATFVGACAGIGALVYLLSHSVGMTPWGLVGLAGWFLAITPIEASRRATGPALIPVLVGTAKLHAVTGGLIALGLVLATTVS